MKSLLTPVARIAIPALVVMIAVVGYVAAAGWNRSGSPRLSIVLTERELPMFQMATAPGEDPGLQLRIAYVSRLEPLDAQNWLTQSRLEEIGFTFDVPQGAPGARDAYDNVPPRLAWIVFEYDGPAWRAVERRRELEAEGQTRHFPYPSSRLVPVDAGPDFDALLVRYPSGHLIVRGVIALAYLPPEQGGPLVHGRLREIIPQMVAVPAELRAVFDGLSARPEGPDAAPRYEAKLAIGRLGLPYVPAASRLEQGR